MRWHGRRVAVYAYTQPVDMRKGFDGLSALITGRLQRDPLTGDVYIFVSCNRIRAKVLHWDGTGLCIYANQRSSHYTSSSSMRAS
jgi:transposase